MSASEHPRRLKIFLSSPGDVNKERGLALDILDELPCDPFVRGQLDVQTVAWDKFPAGVPMRAHLTPQEAIDQSLPRPSECDIVIVIFWARMGTPLPKEVQKPGGGHYFSGTEWEFEDAMRIGPADGGPTVLLYRRTEKAPLRLGEPDFEERHKQWTRVQEFFEALRGPDESIRTGVNPYPSPYEFGKLLWRDLRVLVKEHLDQLGEAAADAPKPAVELWEGSPFPGLRSFSPKDSPIFFGRGRELDELVRRVADPETPFLAVVGASGSGKSSLVSAGLLPRLEKDAIEGSRDWRWLRCLPGQFGDDPFLALAAALVRLSDNPQQRPAELARELAKTPAAWAKHANMALAGRPDYARLVLFVDQFEELFTVAEPSKLAPFVELLSAAAGDFRTFPIVTVRSDFYPRCLENLQLAELMQSDTFSLAAPNPEALLEMIERPAHRAGLTFEEGLAGDIVADTGLGAGRLPLMAFALAELYKSKDEDGSLTRAAYKAFGKVGGAISQRAKSVFDQLEKEVQAALPRVFRELVQVDESLAVTRRRAELGPLRSNREADQFVTKFIAARLLISSQSSEGSDAATVEIAHEALLEGWTELERWINERRDDLLLRRQLEAASKTWERKDQRRPFLWSDERVVEASHMLQRLERQPSDRERAFLGPVDRDSMSELLEVADTGHETRATIGVRLALLGDRRPGIGIGDDGLPEIAWCEVLGGRSVAPGELDDDDVVHMYIGRRGFAESTPPGHVYEGVGDDGIAVQLEPFAVARYPLTWRQFRAFGQAEDGYRDPRWWTQSEVPGSAPERRSLFQDNDPVTAVTWYEATAFCRWLSFRTGEAIGLPSIWQWHLAATGDDPSRAYAWGERWEPERANTIENGLGRPTAVGMYPAGASPVGALDMSGNVWEWCLGSEKTGLLTNDPEEHRALRGGSWNHVHTNARTDCRGGDPPSARYFDLGFRLLRQ